MKTDGFVVNLSNYLFLQKSNMQKQIQTEIIINATPQKVWSIFSDFKSYPEWSIFIKSISGEVNPGNQIFIKIDGMAFKPVVLEYEPMKKLRWLGKLWMKGLFDGEHVFELIDNQNGTTTFRHSENFNGILVGLFAKKLDKETKTGFESFNLKLKERVEQTL